MESAQVRWSHNGLWRFSHLGCFSLSNRRLGAFLEARAPSSLKTL
jgi:hypothetical protein